jgi:hypothetical protein
MQRDYTAWTRNRVISAEEIAVEIEWNRQRAVAEAWAQTAMVRYEQQHQGRHDGSEIGMRINTSAKQMRRAA